MSPNKSSIKNTFKSQDTEEFLDVVFYRPFGYSMALISKKLGVTPNGVTIFSIFVGVLAGHLFYYEDLRINIIGMLLLIWAEGLDSADGQLARMTNHKSRYGRILDGLGGNLWYISIYIHLCLRLINTGLSPAIFTIAVIAGISQSLQCAVADHYRNFYSYFVHGKEKSEVDDSARLLFDYSNLSWSRNFWKKFLMRMYINYTIEQEFISKNTIILLRYVERNFESKIPAKISDLFRNKNKKLIKYYNILTSNTRMIAIFICLILNNIYIFAFFQIICLNLLLLYVVTRHEANSKFILNEAIALREVI
jgi:phosphatidylglycerophosphate synthase